MTETGGSAYSQQSHLTTYMCLPNVFHCLKPGNARNHTGNRQKFGEMLFREECSTQNSLAIGAPQVGVDISQEANGTDNRRRHVECFFLFLL